MFKEKQSAKFALSGNQEPCQTPFTFFYAKKLRIIKISIFPRFN